MIVPNGVGNKPDQAEGLTDISLWLRSKATTPPDNEQGDRKHPEGMPDIEYFWAKAFSPLRSKIPSGSNVMRSVRYP